MLVIVIERVAAREGFDGRARQRPQPFSKVVMGGTEQAAKIPGQEETKLLGCRCGDWFHATPPTPASILTLPLQTRSDKAGTSDGARGGVCRRTCVARAPRGCCARLPFLWLLQAL